MRAGLRIGGITLVMLWPWMTGLRPLDVGISLLATFAAAASAFCTFMALGLKEPFAAGGLNHWDEALAYVALARLMHLVQSLHGS